MKTKIQTDGAPKAIGPYSQGIIGQGQKIIFVSGQVPLDPETGKLVEGDIRALTQRVIDNLEAILRAAECNLDDVVRVDIFLKDLKKDFAVVNEEYAKRFTGMTPPARQTVQVGELPLGASLEMSCIAIK